MPHRLLLTTFGQSKKKNLTEPTSTQINGVVDLNVSDAGTINCAVDAKVNLSFNGTGNLEGFFSECSGSGIFGGCEITTTYGSPWSLQAEGDEVVRADDVSWKWKFSSCEYKATWEASTDLERDPDAAIAISEFKIGSGPVILSSGGVPYGAIGELVGEVEVAGADAGRYGLNEKPYYGPWMWIKEGAQLEETEEVELDGRASVVNVPKYGLEYECGVHAAASFAPGEQGGEQGELLEFDFNPGDCTGSGSLNGQAMKDCSISDPTVSWEFPLEVAVSLVEEVFTPEMATWNVHITTEWSGAKCPLNGVTTDVETELYLIPDDVNGMTSVTLTGLGSTTYLGASVVSGNLDVAPAGVYGLAATS